MVGVRLDHGSVAGRSLPGFPAGGGACVDERTTRDGVMTRSSHVSPERLFIRSETACSPMRSRDWSTVVRRGSTFGQLGVVEADDRNVVRHPAPGGLQRTIAPQAITSGNTGRGEKPGASSPSTALRIQHAEPEAVWTGL